MRTDAEIMARAARHPEEFGVVFDRHFATIHRYLDRRIGRDGADELSGEVFRIAFEQRARFRPLHDSALPWLYGLATNLVLKRGRSEARRLRAVARLSVDPGPDPIDGVANRLDAEEARERLLEGLVALPERDRDVLILLAWEGLSYDEIAVALDIPVGTVRSRLNRARGRLRELLPEFGNERVTC